jgi:hypothetical protein
MAVSFLEKSFLAIDPQVSKLPLAERSDTIRKNQAVHDTHATFSAPLLTSEAMDSDIKARSAGPV